MGKGTRKLRRRGWALFGLFTAAFVLLPGLARCVAAQSITLGTITGSLRDSSGAPLADAIVTLTDQATGSSRRAESASDGRFRFAFLSPGPYELFGEQIGYRPVRLRGLRANAGSESTVDLRLREDSLPVSRVDTIWQKDAAYSTGPGATYALPRSLIERFPSTLYGVASFDAYTSATGEGWGMEGLPASATRFLLDGVGYDVARSPALPFDARVAPALALSGFEEINALTAPLDVESSGFGGGALSGLSRSATRDLSVQAFGDWSPDLGSSRFFDPGAVRHQSGLGGLVVTGPVLRDTADFVAGVEVERLRLPRPALWEGTAEDSAIVAAARDSLGILLDDYLLPRAIDDERVSAFGRFNWRVTEAHALGVWGTGGRLQLDEPAVGEYGAAGLGSRVQGTDVVGGASLTSAFGARLTNELRLGFHTTRREYFAGKLPATFFGSGRAVGTDGTLPGSFRLTGADFNDAVHAVIGQHQVKLGIAVDIAAYNQTYSYSSGGTFYFSDASNLGATAGVYYGVVSPPPVARFTVPQVGGFLQDRWEVAPGFAFLIGLRYDAELLPVSKIARNQPWLLQTGIANDSLARLVSKWSSRVGFDWRVGASRAWAIRGGAGVYYDRVEPGLLAELITQTGRDTVHRGVGTLGPWPQLPDPSAAPPVGALLTIAGPRFEPPRSLKASFGVETRLGRGGTIELSGNVRHADFLPRRHDVNRVLGQTGQDQYGRPIYGKLVKQGALVALDPTSPRRFPGFELVSALDPDGYSDYGGMTVRLVEPLSRFVRLYGSYTYSQTTDNWLSGRYGGPYAQLTPFPDSLGARDWAQGTSDFDVPHRVAAGIELAPLGSRALTLAARYRWQSGASFTPGFMPGVDANGDGSATNDPAFVDDTVPGVGDLMAAWDCLRPQSGRFAERNSCRDPGTGSLDLRLGLSPLGIRGYPIELWAEAFNVVEPDLAVRDHALYLVDPSRPLATDLASGRLTVPLVANQHFGGRLYQRTPGRFLRVGLRVNY